MKTKKEKVTLFMPAYFAGRTLLNVYKKIPKEYIDEIIVVDDASEDQIESVAQKLDIRFYRNERNLGYGGNLKICIQKALETGADILIELHPDDQYDPSAIPDALKKLDQGYDFVMGSRFLKWGSALKHAMPFWKYAINRLSTLPARLILGAKLTDFHSGFRVYRREFLERVAYQNNDNDYLFSFEIIAQAAYFNFRIGEVSVTCRYFPNATQINFAKSMKYGLGALRTLWTYLRGKMGIPHALFELREIVVPSPEFEESQAQVLSHES